MIRRSGATRSDLATLSSLHAASFAEAWDEASFGRLLESPGVFALLFHSFGAPKSFILVRAVAEEAEILSIGVLPSERRKGLAGRLVDAASQQAAQMNAKRMFLEVGAGNMAARCLYRSLGFRQVGARRGYYVRQAGILENALILRAEIPLPGQRLGKRPEFD